MDWTRRLWFALAAVAIVGTVAVLLGVLFGSAGVSVDDVAAAGSSPTNASANCDEVVVRTVSVTVELSRASLSLDNPQWWQVGLSVRASAFGGAKQRQVTLGPGADAEVTIPFTNVLDEVRAPREQVDVVVQVTKGNAEITRETVTATLEPVAPGPDC